LDLHVRPHTSLPSPHTHTTVNELDAPRSLDFIYGSYVCPMSVGCGEWPSSRSRIGCASPGDQAYKNKSPPSHSFSSFLIHSLLLISNSQCLLLPPTASRSS
jgi:hypothetical protein